MELLVPLLLAHHVDCVHTTETFPVMVYGPCHSAESLSVPAGSNTSTLFPSLKDMEWHFDHINAWQLALHLPVILLLALPSPSIIPTC